MFSQFLLILTIVTVNSIATIVFLHRVELMILCDNFREVSQK